MYISFVRSSNFFDYACRCDIKLNKQKRTRRDKNMSRAKDVLIELKFVHDHEHTHTSLIRSLTFWSMGNEGDSFSKGKMSTMCQLLMFDGAIDEKGIFVVCG